MNPDAEVALEAPPLGLAPTDRPATVLRVLHAAEYQLKYQIKDDIESLSRQEEAVLRLRLDLEEKVRQRDELRTTIAKLEEGLG